MLRLNLGCSTTCEPGFMNVDRWTPPWATAENFQQADLRHSWPWGDGSVDYIRAADILEHLPDIIHTMNEIHRVLKPGGAVDIVVPTTEGRGAWQDPTHVSYWNRNTFFYFEHGNAHYKRFHEAYGIKGAFVIRGSNERLIEDGVTKLHIQLEAVKNGETVSGSLEKSNSTAIASDVHSTPGIAHRDYPVFSILHATAHRLPFAWVDTWREWSAKAVHPERHEYIVAVHISDIEKVKQGVASIKDDEKGIPIKVIAQAGRYCAVDNWNEAAKASTGDLLIMGADDFFPLDEWDLNLECVMPQKSQDTGYVMHISTGSPRDKELIVHPFMSRVLYQKWGYFLYPAYEGVYCDDDLTAHAKAEGAVLDRLNFVGLQFDHRHPIITGDVELFKNDPGYKAQNDPARYELGKRIFDARVQCGFKDVTVTLRKTIAVCLPGEHFSSAWVTAWTQLLMNLSAKFNVLPFFAYSSNVYITRCVLTDAVLKNEIKPDYVLWIDDDNLVTMDNVMQLMADLDEHPELDMIAGWCWIQPDVHNLPARVSCGDWSDNGTCRSINADFMISMDPVIPNTIPIDWTGFPVVLMRREMLVKVGPNPFSPFPTPGKEFGFSGEDTAYCKLAKDKGCRMAVDRRVKVPHLKLRAAEPIDIRNVEVINV